LAVTAVFAAWLMHLELAWREWLAVGGVILGVGMLGASAGPHAATGVSQEFKLALIVAVAGVAVAGVAASRLREPARTRCLARWPAWVTPCWPWPPGFCPVSTRTS
jgi:drug/metabolite transporter (DMT)-like permease